MTLTLTLRRSLTLSLSLCLTLCLCLSFIGLLCGGHFGEDEEGGEDDPPLQGVKVRYVFFEEPGLLLLLDSGLDLVSEGGIRVHLVTGSANGTKSYLGMSFLLRDLRATVKLSDCFLPRK